MPKRAAGPTRKHTVTVEREGINYVRSVVERANCIFHPIHGENDYGNDAFIQLVDGELVTGQYVLAQIESGSSYCRRDACNIPATRTQMIYWSSHRLPVLGIVYDPSESTAYWLNVSTYLTATPHALTQETHRIPIGKEEVSRFDDAGFNDFLLPLSLGKPMRLDYERSARFALKEDYRLHAVGLRSLFYQFRNEPETWAVLEDVLRSRAAGDIDPVIAYFFAHVPGHGDIVWHKDSMINPPIRKMARHRMVGWGSDLLVPLLRLVDERGYDRATPGQSVYAIVDLAVESATEKLEDIIVSQDVEESTRRVAVSLYCLVAQEGARPFLERVAREASPIADYAQEMAAHLQREGFFYP